ncbi:MAG: acyl-CoA dehydrogenase family protein [Sphingobium sp.]
MDIARSEEQLLLFETATRYLADHYDFGQAQAALHRDRPFDATHWRSFADMGWLALPISAGHGGLGGDMADLGALMEAFGGGQVIEPYVGAILLAGGLVNAVGSEAQKQALLPGLADGSLMLAAALLERGAQDRPSRVATRALRTTHGWRISGAKILAEGGHAAHRLIISARLAGDRDDESGIGLFVVNPDSAGLSRRDHGLLGGGVVSDFDFDGVDLPADALLGVGEDACATIAAVTDRAIVAQAWQVVGRSQALLDATIDYTRMRRQFGRPLSANQALRHRVADMHVQLIEMRALAASATVQMDGTDTARARMASALKFKAAHAGRMIAEGAIQFHGGIGMTDDLPLGRHYRAILAFAVREGSPDMHLRRYGALSFAGEQ